MKKIQLDYEDGHKEDGNDFDDHVVYPDPDYEDYVYDTLGGEGGGWLEGFKDDVASTIFGDRKLHIDVPVWTKEEIPGQAHLDQGRGVVTSLNL